MKKTTIYLIGYFDDNKELWVRDASLDEANALVKLERLKQDEQKEKLVVVKEVTTTEYYELQ
jgi:hypothetical protein